MKSRVKSTAGKNISGSSKENKVTRHAAEKDNLKNIFCLAVIVVPLFSAYYYYQTALVTNGYLSFPLDDPWIHLTFARNIVDFFSFSYYKNELVTAGSTSPLYVFIAAAGFLITNNEMILSYILGTVFFALSSFFFYKMTLDDFNNETLICLLVCLVFIFDNRMNFIAVSGMETTLFILFIIMSAYFYKTKKIVFLGITLGLLIWTRPDGIALIGAMVLDQLFLKWMKKDERQSLYSIKDILKVSGIFLVFLLTYFAFNFYLSGTILSNTYSAKIALNTESDTRLKFLTYHIWNFFSEEHYKFLIPGFIISTVFFAVDIFKRKQNQTSLYILFILLFILMYLIKLPMFSRFGRYFMPMIPFFIIASMYGYYSLIKAAGSFIKKPAVIKITSVVVFIFLSGFTLYTFQSFASYYAFHCRYIYERQVKTSYWLRDHTSDSDVIAAHDVGAIGYYAKRKIVDIAGLINPELVKESYKENYNEVISDYFEKSGVTYTTFYREWFLIMNQNPLFNAPDDKALEAMYVYRFYPGKTKILPRKMNYLLSEATKYFGENTGVMLVSSMDEIIKTEPDYALAYFYRAYGYYFQNDMKRFEEDIEKSLQLFPDFKEALLESGKILINNGNTEEAKIKFKKVIELDPNNPEANDIMNRINSSSAGK